MLNEPFITWKLGSGRYIQDYGASRAAGRELLRFGKSAFFIGGKTALSLLGAALSASCSDSGVAAEFREYSGACCESAARAFSDEARRIGSCVICGVGGGRIMDLAKLTADFAGLPVVNFPTSSATCAAYTPLSVVYTESGATVGTTHFDHEVAGVVADMDVLSRQPARLFVSGAFDAVAKLIEIDQRILSMDDAATPVGFDVSYEYARLVHDRLLELIPVCSELLRDRPGERSKTLERAVYLAIPVTGLLSALARGDYQSALAHRVYELTRMLHTTEAAGYLHGEIVALGLLAQLNYNGRGSEVPAFRERLRSVGAPVSLREIGVEPSGENVSEYVRELCRSSCVDDESEASYARVAAAVSEIAG